MHRMYVCIYLVSDTLSGRTDACNRQTAGTVICIWDFSCLFSLTAVSQSVGRSASGPHHTRLPSHSPFSLSLHGMGPVCFCSIELSSLSYRAPGVGRQRVGSSILDPRFSTLSPPPPSTVRRAPLLFWGRLLVI